jgi:hypothetical protein
LIWTAETTGIMRLLKLHSKATLDIKLTIY